MQNQPKFFSNKNDAREELKRLREMLVNEGFVVDSKKYSVYRGLIHDEYRKQLEKGLCIHVKIDVDVYNRKTKISVHEDVGSTIHHAIFTDESKRVLEMISELYQTNSTDVK